MDRIKTYKEKKAPVETKPETKNNEKAPVETKKKETITVYLTTVMYPGEYTCSFSYLGKQYKPVVKDGLVDIPVSDLDAYIANGFKVYDADYLEPRHVYLCADYLDKEFDLIMDDESKIAVKFGKARPENKYQREQLLKRGFALYELEK